MRKTFKWIILSIVVLSVVLSIWVTYSSGYRLTPYEAAIAHFDVEKSVTEFGEVNFQWSKVYLFNTSEGPRTVIVTKEGFLWLASATTRISKRTDNIKTVGWISYNGQQGHGMVFAVESVDPSVAYIQVGPATDRIRKEITVKDPVIFSWNKEVDINNLKPEALSKDDKVLYEYRFPKNTTSVSSEDMKWYPAEGF